jgi:hypothetical protein
VALSSPVSVFVDEIPAAHSSRDHHILPPNPLRDFLMPGIAGWSQTTTPLLHEMVHQFLFERGENPKHAGASWRREIMRLTKSISGREIWAGPSKTMRVNGLVVRMNAPHPETGESSLPQKIIARWLHDELGIRQIVRCARRRLPEAQDFRRLDRSASLQNVTPTIR